jgi:hypothetical protein
MATREARPGPASCYSTHSSTFNQPTVLEELALIAGNHCAAKDLGCAVDFLINRFINLLLNPPLLMGIGLWVLFSSLRTGPPVPCAAARLGKLA